MSVETVVSGKCLCGHRIVAGAEEHGSEHDGFYCCPSCAEVTGSEGRAPPGPCPRCRVPVARWDERTCPACGREPSLTWGTAYN